MASLGKDLAAIRKEEDLSYEDIYEATKIPKHIIKSIEDDSIFTDFNENATYIRSYVRSYAKALSIDDQKIIYALDQQKIDKYTGSLRLSEEHQEEPASDNMEDEPPADKPDKSAGQDETPEADTSTENDAEESTVPKEETPPIPSTSATSSRSENVDWGNMGRDVQPVQPKSNLWIGVMITLLILAGGLYYFLSSPDEPEPSTGELITEDESSNPSAAESDSLQLNIIPPAEEDTSEETLNGLSNDNNTVQGTLPDTLDLVVYAAYGKLEPVRVFTDVMGNINPYWIEQGDAIRFDFVNEFRVRGSFDNIVLLMNGHVIEDARNRFYNPDTRLVEIDRSFFEGDNKWLPPPPDTLPIDAPPPSVILERPTYN